MASSTTSTEQHPAQPHTAAVRDLHVTHRSGLRGVLFLVLAFGISFGAMQFLIMRAGIPQWMLTFALAGAVVLTLLGVGGVLAVWGVRAVRAAAAAGTTDVIQLETRLTHALTHRTYFGSIGVAGIFQRYSPLEVATRALAQADAVGTAYRVFDQQTPVETLTAPLEVPFEPTPLSHRTPAFRDLAGDARDNAGRARDDLRMSLAILDPTGRYRWLAKLLIAFGFVCILGWLISAIIDLLHARVSRVVTQVAPAGVMFVVTILWFLWRPRRWTLVPGAIVVSTSTWRSAEWKLHVFRRADSVMLYWRRVNRLVVARRDGLVFSRNVRPDEADLALRAWRSPLEPPALEQMSDLV